MVALSREACKRMERPKWEPRFDLTPLQVGMGRCPWRVAVCSMLLVKARRAAAEPVLKHLLGLWPDAGSLSRSLTDQLAAVLRPCGLQYQRARRLQRFSTQWLGDQWRDMSELTGVGIYVSDAVRLFCFYDTDLKSSDGVLHAYAASLEAPLVDPRSPDPQRDVPPVVR